MDEVIRHWPTEVAPLWRPLQAIWVAWLLAAWSWWPRDRGIWGVTLVALVVRWGLTGPTAPLPHGKGWSLSQAALGMHGLPRPDKDVYGDAWESAGSLVAWGGLGTPEAGRWLALLASVLTLPWLMEGARRAGGGRAVVLGSGLAYALLPVAVAYGQTVTRFALAPMLLMAGMVAWHGLGDRDRAASAAWLGALSAGLLAHTRPFLVVAAGTLWLALAWRARGKGRAVWAALVVGGAVVGWRIGGLAALVAQSERLHGARLPVLGAWLAEPWADPWWLVSGIVALKPTMTPAILAPLALVGLVGGPFREGRGVWAGLAAAALLPWLHFDFAFDLARMQLGFNTFLVVFAAFGVARLWKGVAAREFLAGMACVGLVVSWWIARHPRGEPRWSWVVEDALVREGLPACDPSLPVVIDDVRNAWDLAAWLSVRGWTPQLGPSDEVPPGSCRLVGVDGWLEGPPALDGWAPVETREIAWSSGGWYAREGETITIGWYRRQGARP